MRQRSFRYTTKAVSQIKEFARQRMDVIRIADKMGCRPATIEKICRKHSITLVSIVDGQPPVGSYEVGRGISRIRFAMVDVPIARDALDVIALEAARRGTKPQLLIGRLAEVVAEDNLFAAVFDR